jgi:hypothetical protein
MHDVAQGFFYESDYLVGFNSQIRGINEPYRCANLTDFFLKKLNHTTSQSQFS